MIMEYRFKMVLRMQRIILIPLVLLGASYSFAGKLGAQYEIFVSGGGQNIFREDLMERMCSRFADDVKIYVDDVKVTPSQEIGGRLLEQGDRFVLRCTTKFFGSALDGKDIAVYKYSGGSGAGVAPIVNPEMASHGDMRFLDANDNDCSKVGDFPIGTTGDDYELYECNNSNSHDLLRVQIPDAGISYAEPVVYQAALSLNFGVEARGVASKPTQPFVDKGNLITAPGPGMIFGVTVTLPMYNELIKKQYAAGLLLGCDGIESQEQRDRVECMPSLPAALVTSVFSGQVTSWEEFSPYGLPMDTSGVTGISGGSNDVAICKHANGSGIHAQFSMEFLRTNCGGGNILEQNDGFAFNPAGFVGVFSNNSVSDMSECMDALANGSGFDGGFAILPPENSPYLGDSTVVPGTNLPDIPIPNDPLERTYNKVTTAFAMGYSPTELNTSLVFDYRFIKINGKAPTIENAINGDYSDVYFMSFQYRVADGMPDLKKGSIRTANPNEQRIVVAKAFFDEFGNISTANAAKINSRLVINPDGAPLSGDEWQAGLVVPKENAAMFYTEGVPEIPWKRQNKFGESDSCQYLAKIR